MVELPLLTDFHLITEESTDQVVKLDPNLHGGKQSPTSKPWVLFFDKLKSAEKNSSSCITTFLKGGEVIGGGNASKYVWIHW